METLDTRHPSVGAGYAAMALHALAEVMERARAGRLTRHQHILLRMGEWIAYAECAGTLARRASLLAEGRLNEKANQRFDPAALAAIARIFAREAALKVAQEGIRWIVGASPEMAAADVDSFQAAVNLPAILRAQAGLISDMDFVADVLYGRTFKAAAHVA
jgi:alkylation response protein AidB-like acyl-CoA dehydrogenase